MDSFQSDTLQNIENGIVWDDEGYSRSLPMSPFSRVHTTSYSSLVETMCLSCTVFEIVSYFVEIRQLLPTPSAFGAPIRGDGSQISKRFLAAGN